MANVNNQRRSRIRRRVAPFVRAITALTLGLVASFADLRPADRASDDNELALETSIADPVLRWFAAAEARPVRVRSSTAVQVRVRERGRRPVVRARFVDNVNQGVSSIPLRLRVFDARDQVVEQHTLTTDTLGYARLELALPDGDYRAAVEFSGSDTLEAASASAAFQVARARLGLTLKVPRLVHVERETTLEIEVGGRTPFKLDAPLEAQLTIGDVETRALELQTGTARATELIAGAGVELGATTTLVARMLPRGHHKVRVELPAGNPFFEPAEATAKTTLFRAPRMDVSANVVRERDLRGVTLDGSLRSEVGPLADAQVRAEVADGRGGWEGVGQITSDEDGSYRGFIPLEALPTGEIEMRVVFTPDLGQSLFSKPIPLEVDPPGATGWVMWVLLFFCAAVLGALAVFYTIRLLRTWLARRKHRREPVGGESAESVVVPTSPPDDAPKLNRFGVSGQVVDAVESAPVRRAHVGLMPAGSERHDAALESRDVDARGWFAFPDLEPGRYRLFATAHGYMTGHVDVAIPHDGDLSSFRFILTPVRERVRRIYLWLLERYEPDDALWGRETPREVEARIAGSIGSALSALGDEVDEALLARARRVLETPDAGLGAMVDVSTRIVEEVYFSHRTFPESVALALERLAERLREPIEAERASGRARHLSASRRVEGRPERIDVGGRRI